MPLSSEWWANTPGVSPFRDNVDGSITADTLRQFAQAISSDAASDDWFEYQPGTTNVAAPYVWDTVSGSETVWFAGGGSGQATDNWTYGADTDGQAIFAYGGGVGVLAQVTVTGEITVAGVSEGTTATVVMWAGAVPATPVAVEIGPPVEITNSVGEVLSISGSGSVRIAASGGSIMTGILLTPPPGETIEASASSVSLDFEEVTTLVIARQAAIAAAMNTD